jgi:hypothetical protein
MLTDLFLNLKNAALKYNSVRLLKSIIKSQILDGDMFRKVS